MKCNQEIKEWTAGFYKENIMIDFNINSYNAKEGMFFTYFRHKNQQKWSWARAEPVKVF